MLHVCCRHQLLWSCLCSGWFIFGSPTAVMLTSVQLRVQMRRSGSSALWPRAWRHTAHGSRAQDPTAHSPWPATCGRYPLGCGQRPIPTTNDPQPMAHSQWTLACRYRLLAKYWTTRFMFAILAWYSACVETTDHLCRDP